MNTISFLDHNDLAEYMIEKAQEGKSATAVLFFDDAKLLIKELLCAEDTGVAGIELHGTEWNGYDKEFYVTIDEDLRVWAEEAYHEIEKTGFKGYFRFGGDNVVVLIDPNANSKVIKAAEESKDIFEFNIDSNSNDCCFEELEKEYKEDLFSIIEYFFEHFMEE